MKHLLKHKSCDLKVSHSLCSTLTKPKQTSLLQYSMRTFSKVGKQNLQQQSRSYTFIASLLLLGGSSLLLKDQFKSSQISHRNVSEAEPKIDQTLQKRLHYQIKEELMKPNPTKQVLFVLYDQKNPLHNEYLQEVETKQVYTKVLQKYPNIDIVHINVSADNNDKSLNDFLSTVDYKQDKISSKKRPTVFLRADDRVSKICPSNINEKYYKAFNTTLQKQASYYNVKSIRELADYLQKFNKQLNDTTIVYFNDPDTQDNNSTKISFRLMRQESENPILVVSDSKVGEKMRMQKGKFYVYYKPSFINGFEQFIEKDINFNYLQAYEGVCRDEFTVNAEYVEGEEFSTLLSKYKGLQTEKFATDIFDQCFSRSYLVEFSFNPNFKEFKKKFKYGTAQKPILFVYSPPMYMSRYISDFKEVLKNYSEVFDIYYTGDQKQASEIFYTKEFPELFPYVVIIDTKKQKALKSPAGLTDLSLANNNFYYNKYREIIFFNRISKDLNKLVEKFMDGEAHHFYQSERMSQLTKVKKICSANFEKEILKNEKVEQCLIEIFKHDCPSCSFNGKVFNAFSRKLEKHGYLDKLPCYRLAIDNKVPFIGNFGYSPIYLYVRKRGNEIVELKTIDPPQRTEEFIKGIQDLSKIKGFSEKIKLKARDQVLKHVKMEDLDDDFDIDFDTKEVVVEEVKQPAQQQEQQASSEQQQPANQ